ncbi:hypothetical protein [Xanthocytophaga agilis]|uniref:Uncharacterized protein n=1 Tax=Xanthocytophaga agilis TaxID=3048010 RepID=A0AAE3R374_9BACT|nr:hypothetical protein [Xanthocytophaga agilis]MDJ1500514.1 hypothetical protein [Xanthocytophaga agilis]
MKVKNRKSKNKLQPITIERNPDSVYAHIRKALTNSTYRREKDKVEEFSLD